MKKSVLFIWVLFLFLSALPPAYASDNELDELQTKLGNEWVLIRYDRLRNIKSYMKQEDGKRYRSFKLEAFLNNKAEVGARVLLDADNYVKWYWQTYESKMLKQVSPTEYYIYLKHRAPVGLPDRDCILHGVVTLQKKPTDPIILTVKSAPDYIPEDPKLVRMIAQDMVVEFTPLPNDRFKMIVEGYVDPGGRVPTWANNYIQRIAPYSIMLGLLRMVSSDYYRDNHTPLPFKVYNYPDSLD